MSESAQVSEKFLEGMRGLHLPAPVSNWPSGPGWWLLASLLVVTLGLLLYRFYCFRVSMSLQHQVTIELDKCLDRWRENNNSQEFISSANALFKRLAIQCGYRQQVARLHGLAWTDWLAQHSGHTLSAACCQAMSSQCYQASGDVNIESVQAELHRWLRACTLQSKQIINRVASEVVARTQKTAGEFGTQTSARKTPNDDEPGGRVISNA